jgi:hypothetical protein
MGLALAALLCLASGAAAQDNDDDGVLPALNGGGGALGGGPGPALESGASDVSVSGGILMATLDDDQAHVRVESLESLSFVSDPDDATMVTAGGEPIRADLLESLGDLNWQGQATVALPPGLDVTFVAAPAAIYRTSVLMISDGLTSLDALLEGDGGQPSALLRVGDVLELDLHMFRSVVAYHAQGNPDVYVTWVFAALNADGSVRLSAVRASGDGQVVEVSAN